MILVRRAWLLGALAGCLSGLAGCGGSHSARPTHGAHPTDHRAAGLAQWSGRLHLRGVVDLTSPRPDGSIVVAADGHLDTLAPGGAVRQIAPRYSAPAGAEAYLAMSSGQRVPGAGCAFAPGSLYALRLNHGVGVTMIDARGGVRKFAALPPSGLENGIAFDTAGRFGHRLLITATQAHRTTLFAIDCRGRVRILTRAGPAVEGGMTVAPRSFGRFGGDLLAPDELSGRLYAFDPNGRATLIGSSGVPHGQDTGVESEGVVPSRFGEALMADRGTPGNPHPGDNLILGMSRATLAARGVLPGDLLVAGEGGGATIDVRCRATCQIRHIANGPRIAHVEGHIVFTRAGAQP